MIYKRFSVPSIWREIDQLQSEMNRLFEASDRNRLLGSPRYPAINLWTNDEGQLIQAEMPGLKADDINIDVTADTLTISGNLTHEENIENARYQRQERTYGTFTRTIQLPFMVETSNVEAKFKNGILNIKLQRAESSKPKKIAVKSE
ncbi:MAG: Hsp20/alpha crystallin family protein [Anaerolineaceae bacterium]|nr:Hsp20/alpha crystallin family protein [Anaerolineaceae bacterium]